MKKQLIAFLVVLMLALGIGAAHATELVGVANYPLEQLRVGMKGVGYTVIRGTKIETFNVEILERIPKGGFDGGPMILARFTGEVVDHSKGIAGGYSGSPVYIDGKLLGAVSMAIPFTDTHIGGITPIGNMLAALPKSEDEYDVSRNTVLPATSNPGTPLNEHGEPLPAPAASAETAEPAAAEDSAAPVEGEAEPSAQPEAESAEPEFDPESHPAPEGQQASTEITYLNNQGAALKFNEHMRAARRPERAAVAAKTPVLSTGFSAAVLKEFGDELAPLLGENFDLITEATGIGGSLGSGNGEAVLGPLLQESQNSGATPPGLFFAGAANQPALKPGAAVTVSLMQGDLEMNAIGTLTYSDPTGRFLIFGHPMMGMGATNMPLGEGYVTWTHTSIQRAFKDGVRLNTLGTMTEDRGAACGGSFNEQADMIPVKVRVRDIDHNTEQNLRFEVIRHPDFTPILLAMGMAQASQQVLDRQLGGTMKLSYHIEGAGLKEPLRRTNFYSDDSNVVFNGALEIVPMANLLHTNIYRDVTVTKVEVMVEITRNRVNASIDDAKIVWDKQGDGSQAEPPSINADSGAGSDDSADVSEPAMVDMRSMTQNGEPTPPQDGQNNPQTSQMMMPGMMGMGAMSPDMPTFAPGETIKVRVRLQPYRTDAVWREFEIRVPDDFPSGNTMLMVHGGGDLISASELNGKGRNLFGMGPQLDVKERDLDNILDQIIEWPLNNELLLTLVRPFDPTAPQELTTTVTSGGPAVSANENKPKDKIDAKYQMEWVIYNGFMLPVNIMTKVDQAKAEQAKSKMEAAKEAAAEARKSGSGRSGRTSKAEVDRSRDISSPSPAERRRQAQEYLEQYGGAQ